MQPLHQIIVKNVRKHFSVILTTRVTTQRDQVHMDLDIALLVRVGSLEDDRLPEPIIAVPELVRGCS